ncbi:MAG: PD40 domain-containing protein [Chloroflexota bacterium]|nr:PD40 domain-containing protein [Chloroflexota bacterium]
MDLPTSQMLTPRRILIGAVLVTLALGAAACGSATPTPAPVSPTLSALVQQTAAPTVPPTATGQATIPPLPTAGTPSAPVTPTIIATATTVRTKVPAPTSVPLTPKPVALSGKIAYDVFNGGTDFVDRTINSALVSGNTGGPIIARASWPAYSPDGGRIAFFHWTDGLYIANSDGGGAIGPLYTSPGVCCLNWSRDGVWIVFADSPVAKTPGGPIKMLKVDGVYKTIVNLNVFGNGPSFSPDGKQIVWSGCLPNTSTCGLIVTPTDGSGATRVLTRDNGGNAHWSPDGKKIVYQATDDAMHHQVFVINADGSGGRKQLTDGKSNDGQPAWSRDGGSIFWRSDQNGTAWAIFVMNADGSNKRRLIANTPADPNLWPWESISVAP